MSKKIVGGAIIILGFVFLLGIIYILFINPEIFSSFFNKEKTVVEETDNIDFHKNINIEEEIKQKEEKKVKEIKVVQKKIVTEKTENIISDSFKSDKDDLMRMSFSFAERFGSYSNQSNYTNLSHLMIFMTTDMKSWTENFISKARLSKGPSDIYYGITTRAVKTTILKYDEEDGEAQVLVNTRRKEASASTENQSDSFSQDLIISFIKENGVWKVDSADWQ